MNQSFLSLAVVACAGGVFLTNALSAQVEVSADPQASSGDSPIGFQFPFPGSEPPTQAHGSLLLPEEAPATPVSPAVEAPAPSQEAVLPPLNPETLPLPRADSPGASSPKSFSANLRIVLSPCFNNSVRRDEST